MKKIVLMIALGLSVVACGKNDCDKAVDKMNECGVSDTSNVDTNDCSGQNECAAKCVNSASCAEIKGEDLNGGFLTCMSKC